jgi:ribulose kinase
VTQDENTRTPEELDRNAQQPERVLPTPQDQAATNTTLEPGTIGEPGGADANAPTIGTGTSIALGCVAGTVLLILIGLIYLAIAALF